MAETKQLGARFPLGSFRTQILVINWLPNGGGFKRFMTWRRGKEEIKKRVVASRCHQYSDTESDLCSWHELGTFLTDWWGEVSFQPGHDNSPKPCPILVHQSSRPIISALAKRSSRFDRERKGDGERRWGKRGRGGWGTEVSD